MIEGTIFGTLIFGLHKYPNATDRDGQDDVRISFQYVNWMACWDL